MSCVIILCEKMPGLEIVGFDVFALSTDKVSTVSSDVVEFDVIESCMDALKTDGQGMDALNTDELSTDALNSNQLSTDAFNTDELSTDAFNTVESNLVEIHQTLRCIMLSADLEVFVQCHAAMQRKLN